MSDASRRAEFARFADEVVAPPAQGADARGAVDPAVVDALRDRGYLGCVVPQELGGLGMSQVDYGLLTGEVGRACASARTLMTVQGLVTEALMRWGSPALKAAWLTPLARGSHIGAFALSEEEAGSDASLIRTCIERDGDDLLISGRKQWISYGQSADVFLIFGRLPDGFAAVLVPGDTPGLTRQPVAAMTGTRAAMMAHINLDKCRIGGDSIVGRTGFGLSHVAATALDHGRYSVAWGAVGIAEAAISFAGSHARTRTQFGSPLIEMPAMRARLAKMGVAAQAARALCLESGNLRDARSPSALMCTVAAKYAASKAAVYAANEAVHIHGARGLMADWPVERLLRDAKVTEIIEGSSDVLESMLGGYYGEAGHATGNS